MRKRSFFRLQQPVNIFTSVFLKVKWQIFIVVCKKQTLFLLPYLSFLVIFWLQHSLVFTVLKWHYVATFSQLDQPLIQLSTTLILYSPSVCSYVSLWHMTQSDKLLFLQSKLNAPVRAVRNQLLSNEDLRRIRAVAPRILSIDSRWRWRVRFMLRSLYHGVLRLEGGMARSTGLEVVEIESSIFPSWNRRHTENTRNESRHFIRSLRMERKFFGDFEERSASYSYV